MTDDVVFFVNGSGNHVEKAVWCVQLNHAHQEWLKMMTLMIKTRGKRSGWWCVDDESGSFYCCRFTTVFSKQYSQERMISISFDFGVVVGDSCARKCPFPWLSDTSVVQLKRMDFGLLLALLLGNQTHPRKRSLLEDQHRDCCSFHSTQGSRLFRLLRSLTWRRRRRATSCAE